MLPFATVAVCLYLSTFFFRKLYNKFLKDRLLGKLVSFASPSDIDVSPQLTLSSTLGNIVTVSSGLFFKRLSWLVQSAETVDEESPYMTDDVSNEENGFDKLRENSQHETLKG